MNDVSLWWRRWSPVFLSVVAGAGLGCFFRPLPGANVIEQLFALVTSPIFSRYFMPIMTVSFVLSLVLIAMGYITVREYLRAKSGKAVPWYQWIFLPWASVLLAMLVSLAVKWEGLICLAFASPVMLAFSFLGGIFAWVAWRDLGGRSPGRMTACALPLVLLFLVNRRYCPRSRFGLSTLKSLSALIQRYCLGQHQERSSNSGK